MTTAIFKRPTGEVVDQCTPDPRLNVGDTIPRPGFTPSKGEAPRLTVTARHCDYHKDTVTYTVAGA